MNFTDEYRWDITRGCVIFISRDDGKRNVHYVSEEALEHWFGFNGPAEESARAYEANKAEINRLAAVAVAEGQVNDSGGANITSGWLGSKQYRRR